MFLPIAATFGARTAVVAIPARTIEPWTIATSLPGVALTLPARPAELWPIAVTTFVAVTEAWTVAAALVTPVAAIFALLPGLLVAAVVTAEFFARPPETAPFAATFEIPTFAAVTEFAAFKASGRARIVAITTLRTIIAVAPRWAIIAIPARWTVVATKLLRPAIVAAESRSVPARLERALFTVALSRGTIAEWPIAARPIIAAEPRPVAAPFAVEFFGPETALFELLLRPPRLAGAAPAAEPAVAPPAGSVVFIVVAGHERLVFKVKKCVRRALADLTGQYEA